MPRIELSDVDLNLLVLFMELLRRRSVSAAAESLGISQPAASNALARLRRMLGDRLFHRTPHGIQPTPYAEGLAEQIGETLDALREALNRRSVFDPAHSTRNFVVAMTDIGEIYFVPSLMKAIRSAAPQVTVGTAYSHKDSLRAEMESGAVDLAIGLLPDLKTDFHQRRLFEQEYVCMFRDGHPLGAAEVDVDAFAAAEHVVVSYPGTGHGRVDQLIERAVRRKVALRIEHFVALPQILEATDLVATVPERIARRLTANFSLKYVPHPLDLGKVQINVFWHARYHNEPGNTWLRRLIFDTFAD